MHFDHFTQIDAAVNGIQCSRVSAWISPSLHRMRAPQRIATKYWAHYNQWCCLQMWRGTTRQIPDSKQVPRSIYDVLTQSSNDLQWSLCRIRCRHGVCVWAKNFQYKYNDQYSKTSHILRCDYRGCAHRDIDAETIHRAALLGTLFVILLIVTSIFSFTSNISLNAIYFLLPVLTDIYSIVIGNKF